MSLEFHLNSGTDYAKYYVETHKNKGSVLDFKKGVYGIGHNNQKNSEDFNRQYIAIRIMCNDVLNEISG